jgi:transposase
VQVVTAGNYLKTAAQFAGVSQSTLMGWLARGRAAAALADRGDAGPRRRSYRS